MFFNAGSQNGENKKDKGELVEWEYYVFVVLPETSPAVVSGYVRVGLKKHGRNILKSEFR